MFVPPLVSVSIFAKTKSVLEPITEFRRRFSKWIGCKGPCSLTTIERRDQGGTVGETALESGASANPSAPGELTTGTAARDAVQQGPCRIQGVRPNVGCRLSRLDQRLRKDYI
jgi:hypothetical protein